MSNIIQTLRERGLLQDLTDPAIEELLSREKVTVYAGFDPSADSLHIGSLIGMMVLKHFQLHGHRPIAVLGGATGMVGDPSGRSAERNLMDAKTLAHNIAGIRRNLERFLDFSPAGGAILVNNADWLGKFSFLDFLRDVGKYFRIGDMLAKDSVKRRLESEAGISFTEFSYMLLQAYDFLHLFREFGCKVQAGGSDQWGNITAGTELIRRIANGQGYGVTWPLLTGSDGEKMGKTANGAVWLAPEKFSPYEFYQFWIRQDDPSLDGFFKKLTLLPLDEIRSIISEHKVNPSKRVGQRRLAFEITKLVHGEAEARKARDASEALFGGALSRKTDAELKQLFNDVPSVQVPRAELDAGIPLLDLLVRSALVDSKKEARRVLGQNGVYLNNSNDPWPEAERTITPGHLASESMLVLRVGRKNYCLVQFV